MAKSNYRALTRVHHNKKPYDEGETLALESGEASPLLAVKAIEEVVEEKAAPAKTE